MQTEQKSQLDLANDELLAIKGNVTTSDRNEAKKEYSEFTIVQYLKGEGKDLDTAFALLQFFRKRIQDRGRLIANSK